MTLAVVVVTLALLGATVVVGALGWRSWLTERQRRRLEISRRLRSSAMALVDTDDAEPPILTGVDAVVFAELLARYSRGLRGEADARIAAYFEGTGAVDEFRHQLTRRRERHRVRAAFALGDMGSPRAVPDLLTALEDDSLDVRSAAARSLGRLGATDAVEALIDASVSHRVPRAIAGTALLEIGPRAVSPLVRLLDHPDPHFRSDAVELIGLLGSASDAEALPTRLRDTSSEVRAATAAALGRLGAGTARDALISALDDRVRFVRSAAARALGQIGGRSATQALLEVARHDDFDPAS